MAMDQKTDNTYSGILILGVFLILLQLIPFFNYIDILPELLSKSQVVQKLSTPVWFYTFRVLYILLVIALSALLIHPNIVKKTTKDQQPAYRMYYYFTSALVLVGTIQHPYFYYYNIILFPFLLFIHIFFASRGFARLSQKADEKDPFGRLSTKPLKEMGLVFQTTKGPLHVHNVFQGIYVAGGAGAGKSASVIEPAIYQWIQQNASMTIYDFKGNPPTLGLMAYNSWLQRNQTSNKKEEVSCSFGIVSFNTEYLAVSDRPNMFDPRTLESVIDTQSVLFTFLNGLNPDWRQKKDFWGQSATAAALGIVERLRNDPELHPYCTLPHFIEFATSDPTTLLNWIRQDPEVTKMIQTLLTNLDGDVMQTLSNQMSSLQAPLNSMFSRELYWVFGAEPENQTSLDVNNPIEPKILSISNDPKRAEALSPAIGSLLKAIMRTINQQGKHPTAFVIDELPTIYLDELSKLPATARSNMVCSLFGVQDESQLETQYGKSADEIIANLGNFFLGMTNNPKTAKKYSDYFGTYEVNRSSTSLSDSSMSISDSLKDKKLLQDAEIAGQPVGHFIGKIADGDPPFFSVQTQEFKKEKYFKDWQKNIRIEPKDPFIKSLFENNPPEIASALFKDIVEHNYLRIKFDVKRILENSKLNH